MTVIRLPVFGFLAVCLMHPALGSPFAARESAYAAWRDAHHAVDTLEAGSLTTIDGGPLTVWRARLLQARNDFDTLNAQAAMTMNDRRAQRLMIADVAANNANLLASGAERGAQCIDRDRAHTESALTSALYDCFSQIGNHLVVQDQIIGRSTALELLSEEHDANRREQIFRSFTPLWQAINGASSTQESPYRRLIQLTAQHRSSAPDRIDLAARTVGTNRAQVERWLISVLTAWSQATSGADIEPWDYWHAHSQGLDPLNARITTADVQPLSARYFRDLGADLDQLKVLHDLAPRVGKAPLSYTDYIRIGQTTPSGWRPAWVRVSATLEKGGFSAANEIIHEDGHAVHMMALRSRPAFFDLGDAVFYEAFADVPSWSVAEPAFQTRYLGIPAGSPASKEALYAGVMLDVAWALFEIQMLNQPGSDPNQLWAEITQRYLHIVPHPELAWWGLRVQLVHEPGYMINYGLGAILTAQLRERITKSIGAFDAGNPAWYGWVSRHLLHFGEALETPVLLRQFLRRPVSDRALRNTLRHLAKAHQVNSEKVASRMDTASSISAAVTTSGGMNRTVD